MQKLERIFIMPDLNIIARLTDRDNIKATFAVINILEEEIASCDPAEPSLLVARDRFFGFTVLSGAPGLNLDKHQHIPIVGDYIYLAPFITKISSDDTITFFLQIVNGNCFAIRSISSPILRTLHGVVPPLFVACGSFAGESHMGHVSGAPQGVPA